jgi:hypothetical protein
MNEVQGSIEGAWDGVRRCRESIEIFLIFSVLDGNDTASPCDTDTDVSSGTKNELAV